MKKITIIALILALGAGLSARADEGMWLPSLISQRIGDMQSKGFRLDADDIYNINQASLKDAVVLFGRGCTGELVSGEGLLLTNHHCGYSQIQQHSSVDHDYLKDGFWAMSRAEELPNKGLTVSFLDRMEDVTSIILKGYDPKMTEEERVALVKDNSQALIAEATKDGNGLRATVEALYYGNQYFLFVYREYSDVRLVGAPPSSIGKFGGDTDNWMWPRHTGDFSMFRVYADANNNPAAYSKDNVPYTPKQFLKISLAGVKEGDFTMIMGYPGRTTRFQTSPELKHQIETNDIRIAARTVRQNKMLEDMLADPKVKIQYASKYSGSSNGWKKWQGMKLAFEKLGIIERAEKEELEFLAWVKEDKKRTELYGDAVNDIRSSVYAMKETDLAFTLAYESLYNLELPNFAGIFRGTFARSVKNGKDTLAALNDAYNAIAPKYKDYSAPTDQKITKAMLKFYREKAKPANFPKNIGNFETMDIDAWVDDLFENSNFTSLEKLELAIKEKGALLVNDPAVEASASFSAEVFRPYGDLNQYRTQLSKSRQAYTAGLLEWRKGEPSYPDANFTMRLTYGTVKGYSPKDGVLYQHYTTLKGVMEKEDPDNWEFVVPEKLKELYKFEDFGQYAMADGRMPVAFLSNNDITGGHSGSPIMHAKGELIGLAFDGNWESMSSDVMFEPDLQRCINVDIRYVLFIVEKFGGAKWLVDEMEIVE